ncbi:putative oligopeptide transporter (OPT) family protein [Scopulibacillus darangshiensis]|uniref:Putative oligopeptide transporter (OPT) family protein n=1 Tax=Scopulibacillus darangshiensis TaxID=442528 RepID=A0A4V2SN25_9BACL|nr:OPT/YSL family transporter [Scopulibacillus darangshiensis]TCP29586.1 putative oligopeptide transporter (OPT) family protein [Scopulibacillus darangshiensis]
MKKGQFQNETPSILSPLFLIIVAAVSVFGAIVGLQLITSLGISANTSIIGALLAMVIARIPVSALIKFKSVHTQNLVQTSISAATFGAANSLLIPIGIPFLLGRTDLIIPMFIGAVLALFVDAILLYRFFDSKLFPAAGIWPPGIATAESIKAGDEGGKKAGFLGAGIVGGIVGAWAGIPMSAFGVAFIGNIMALTMFGIGLLVRAYSEPVFGIDIDALYIPHGFMIGAGVVALIQMIFIIMKDRKNTQTLASNEEAAAAENAKEDPLQTEETSYTRTRRDTSKAFGYGFIAYLAVALILALIGGLISHMSIPMLIGYMLFAAFAAFIHEIIVGVAAMHSGWFPAFAVALITLIIGMLIGFPPIALALLVGFSAATGPAFADMAYDFKTGYILRGNGKDREAELYGRRQQFKVALIGFAVASVVVLLTFNHYFQQGLLPPVDKVFTATIQAGVSADVAMKLLIWAIPGALLQLIGGPKRQMGVLGATGLLINFPMAAWAVLAGIAIRVTILKVVGKKAEPAMYTAAAGFIAGDALFTFFHSIFKVK